MTATLLHRPGARVAAPTLSVADVVLTCSPTLRDGFIWFDGSQTLDSKLYSELKEKISPSLIASTDDVAGTFTLNIPDPLSAPPGTRYMIFTGVRVLT